MNSVMDSEEDKNVQNENSSSDVNSDLDFSGMYIQTDFMYLIYLRI